MECLVPSIKSHARGTGHPKEGAEKATGQWEIKAGSKQDPGSVRKEERHASRPASLAEGAALVWAELGPTRSSV
jgi:hypothetical protein